MKENAKGKDESKKKPFFAKIFEKLDKKMEEKSTSKTCCRPGDKEGNSCCS